MAPRAAARSGKPAKASAQVAKLEKRRDELQRHAEVLEPESLKLQAERTGRLLEHAETDLAEKSAAADQARREVQEAQERENARLTGV